MRKRLIQKLAMPSLAKIRLESTGYAMVNEELDRRWTSRLSEAGLDGRQTLAMMKKTNTILSGSAALDMMMPGIFEPADLDFYCPRRRGVQVALFFYGCGYRLLPPPAGVRRSYGCIFNGLNVVITMVRQNDRSKKINIVESSSKSPHAPVLFFHSTVLMNFVSSEGFTMLYPSLTVLKEGKYCG